ncbi:tyrosine-type recombinase/integrase [Psychrobacillus sp. PGGUH221]|uniref:site-specific tyrosine recombinase/integron integrase n=1 Tax=Psychrobacillus sp. PGGUH221 TaxID=3020058 RepID=UPI0035C743E3
MNQDMIQSFINDNVNRYSSDTIKSYKIALSQFFSNCPKNYDEVKAKDIREWLAVMTAKGLKTRSVELKLTAVKSFYKYCMEENKLNINPTQIVQTPKKEESLPYYLNKKQLAMLQELTKDHPRDRAIVESLYSTGVRISELLNIKLEDIKWESRQIWVRKGKGNKERFVLFTYECAERLKTYLEDRNIDSPYLFPNQGGKPLSRDLVEHNFRKYKKVLGFRMTPHTMRHTFAAHLAEKGMDFNYIQELLGHSNINSTRIYTRLMNNARKKQYDQYHT